MPDTRDKGMKFMNQFYLFNGLPKYYERMREDHFSKVHPLTEEQLQECDNNIKILSNLTQKKNNDIA